MSKIHVSQTDGCTASEVDHDKQYVYSNLHKEWYVLIDQKENPARRVILYSKMKRPRIGERNDQTAVNVHNNLSREADFFVAILNDVRLRQAPLE